MDAPLQHLERLSRRPRRAAAVLLWAYVWASLVGGLHFALEAHSVCAHGELTHRAHACAAADGVGAEAPAVSERVAQAPEFERGDVHAHCEWVGRACPERATADAHGLRAPPRTAAPVAEPREDGARTSVPRLALAPHHGPPRRV